MTPAHNLPLHTRCTLGVGGPARAFYAPTSEEDLIALLERAEQQQQRVWIHGGGSNIVYHDDGWDGWVLHPALHHLRFSSPRPDRLTVRAGAGVVWDDLVRASTEHHAAGIEAMSGIPGHVGAAPIQNIGAYGQELSHTLTSVRTYDRENKKIVVFSNADCGFAYRTSRFKREGHQRHVLLDVTLELERRTGPIPLRYGDLRTYFQSDQAPDVQSVRQAVLEIRRRKGMVYDASMVDSHSVGSFFMNPVVDAATRSLLLSKAEAMQCGQMPQYPQDDGRWKLSAAWLISHAGVERGTEHGGARISSRHVLAIVNGGNATAAEVRALARHVQNQVHEVWGVWLVPEARIMTPTGVDDSWAHPPHAMVKET